MIEQLCIFSPCYQIPPNQIGRLLEQFNQLQNLLGDETELHVHLVDDGSHESSTGPMIELAGEYDFAKVILLPENVGNAGCIAAGYRSLLETFDGPAVSIGCCDSDGEHDPRSFADAIEYFREEKFDSFLGSVQIRADDGVDALRSNLTGPLGQNEPSKNTFLENASLENASLDKADLAMIRFLALDQSRLLGLVKPLQIHSPGFQLHRADLLKRVFDLLPRYQAYFEKQIGGFPRWGLHYVIAQLASFLGARIVSEYLPCWLSPPNRTPEKRLRQAQAAVNHMLCLQEFKKEAGLGSDGG